ncbi:hypothetical protein KR018_007004 [Drosophila ironensis]|nr:hypothetical protein KR018_007004 [Drosophila ironensis]
MDAPVQKAISNIYFRYSIAIGITSHRLTNKKFQRSSIARVYALIVNILTLFLLPIVMWMAESTFSAKRKFPTLILITYNVRYGLTYLVIVYTILSRGFRDTVFKEMQPLIAALYREEQRYGLKLQRTSLQMLLYLKCFTVIWLCVTDSMFLFYARGEMNWLSFATYLFLTNAFNILHMTTMGYFLALWHMATGYSCVKQRLNEIITSNSRDLHELHHLWALHATLTKSVLKINKIYGPQMLATRFESFIYGVIQAYWGTFFAFGVDTPPVIWLIYGCTTYFLHALDFFLIDNICDLLENYQNSMGHSWSERRWRKETNAFVTYANSYRLKLWTCGLFEANRSFWFDMISNVLYYFIMLLQFHLATTK